MSHKVLGPKGLRAAKRHEAHWRYCFICMKQRIKAVNAAMCDTCYNHEWAKRRR